MGPLVNTKTEEVFRASLVIRNWFAPMPDQCPFYRQKQTSPNAVAMSAMCLPKADIGVTPRQRSPGAQRLRHEAPE
jgi:hypothetical protein